MGRAKAQMMELSERGYGNASWSLCFEHVADDALRTHLAPSVTERRCTFCQRTADPDVTPFAVSGEAVMEVVMDAVRFLYEDADNVLPYVSADGGYLGPQADKWEVGWEVVDGAFTDDVGGDICDAICESIDPDIVWTPANSRGSADHLEFSWSRFCEVLKHEHRYLFARVGTGTYEVEEVLDFLSRIDEFVSHDFGLIEDLPEKTKLYRGRLSESRNGIPPSLDNLGIAPPDRASAGRFSPAGVPLFYAAPEPETAVIEIASHGTADYATVGEFELLRPLRVLNLCISAARVSVFDEQKRDVYVLSKFLASFVEHVTTPILPDGRERVDYVPTQVLAEYLRSMVQPPLDGLILPSAQHVERSDRGLPRSLTYQQNSGTIHETHVYFVDRDSFVTTGEGACSDEQDSSPRPPFAFDSSKGPRPSIEFDPAKVRTYRVIREYSAIGLD